MVQLFLFNFNFRWNLTRAGEEKTKQLERNVAFGKRTSFSTMYNLVFLVYLFVFHLLFSNLLQHYQSTRSSFCATGWSRKNSATKKAEWSIN
uniref:Uncharacterized protein n=1 Tax=Nelumbo nucifera TaxID=4432 RepID=A0A822ZWA3_NELNU|nr:TPA_asm: hypothetical protein HUJ06_017486 [Nelumbo nucifera]